MNFEDSLRDNSIYRVSREMSQLLFTCIKKVIFMSKKKDSHQTKQDFNSARFQRTVLFMQKLVTDTDNKINALEAQNNDESNEDANDIRMSLLNREQQIRMNIVNSRSILKTITALNAKTDDKSQSLTDLLCGLSVMNLYLSDSIKEYIGSDDNENTQIDIEEEIEEIPNHLGNGNSQKIAQTAEMETDSKNEKETKNKQENDEDDDEDLLQNDPLSGALRDLLKFSNEFVKEKVGPSDFHILTDCLCIILGMKDSFIRQKTLKVFECFTENFDEEVIDIVDDFLFEDIQGKIQNIETGVGLTVNPDNLNLGEDILIDSEPEEESKNPIKMEVENSV